MNCVTISHSTQSSLIFLTAYIGNCYLQQRIRLFEPGLALTVVSIERTDSVSRCGMSVYFKISCKKILVSQDRNILKFLLNLL